MKTNGLGSAGSRLRRCIWVVCLAAQLACGQVIINEVHYEPANNADHVAFIEIYNAGNASVHLGQWQLEGGVSFIFPNGTYLAPGAYRVIAEDPAGLQNRFQVASLGPWQGSLDKDSDEILLRQPDGQVEDRVSYRCGFPWPTDTLGRSMELIHPSLDNDLGGSWRASGYDTESDSSSLQSPTPGRVNSVWSAQAAPQIRQVDHEPKQPASSEPIVISAKVTDPDVTQTVELAYQIVSPGDYLPATMPLSPAILQVDGTQSLAPNPAFEDPAHWLFISMHDDGSGADQEADDDVYTAQLPAQSHRTLLRYRIRAVDRTDQAVTVPYRDDLSLNFACWIYDGVPPYEADTHSVLGTPHQYDTQTLTSLPVYHLITRHQDLDDCLAYDTNDQIHPNNNPGRFVWNWEGALVYDGKVYDHIHYRLRGGEGRYLLQGKRNMKLRFNRGREFEARDYRGQAYDHPWSHLNVSRLFDNHADLPEGASSNYGLSEMVNSILFNLMDVPTPDAHWFHLRVVDAAEEAPDQYHGDFWGLFLALEAYGSRFMTNHNLAEGNLYERVDGIDDPLAQLQHQGRTSVIDGSDVIRLRNELSPNRSEAELDTLVDYDHFYRFAAVATAIRHYNFPDAMFTTRGTAYYFAHPSTANPYGMLRTLPWDTELTWGPNAHRGRHETWWALGDDGYIQTETPGGLVARKKTYRNTLREFRDLLWNPDTLNPLLDALAETIAVFADADRDRWRHVPEWALDAGAHNGFSGSLQDKVTDMKAFAWEGGSHWPSTAIDVGPIDPGGQSAVLDDILGHEGDADQVPDTPTIAYNGLSGYPIDDLQFSTEVFSDPQGSHTFAALRWRIAEVTESSAETPAFEINPVWDSGDITPFALGVTIPSYRLDIHQRYRVRVRMQDTTGRWSHWSAPIEFVTGPPAYSTLQDHLRITEIMYHPADPPAGHPDAEFIEFTNTGSVSLDLTSVQLGKAVNFVFPERILVPEERVIVVKDRPVFESIYGTRLPIVGEYTGRLNNNGDTIVVRDPWDQIVQEIEYEDQWYPLTDGQGFSLVDNPTVNDPASWSQKDAWQASRQNGGSPGWPETVDLPEDGSIVINEILAHSHDAAPDWVELYNTTNRAIHIGGWFLSDNPGLLTKYEIPSGTTVAPGGYVVFYEDLHFGNPSHPGTLTPFALSDDGETLYFSSGLAGTLTSYREQETFTASDTGVSFGRWQKSNGAFNFVPLEHTTAGAVNADPLVGPIVINEIMYNPPSDGDAEYIEILNIRSHPVKLYDVALDESWRFTDDPANPSIDLRFAAAHDVVLGAGEVAILARDLGTFLSLYTLAPGTKVFEWDSGGLSNAGEKIQLSKAGELDILGQRYWVRVDRVIYDDGGAWPKSADGRGQALQRIDPSAYGNDSINWQAGLPTPGIP